MHRNKLSLSLMLVGSLALISTTRSYKVALADTDHPSQGIDYAKLAKDLQEGGLDGWIHASVPGQGLYVFTWRDPKDFFTNAQFPLVSHVPGVMDQIKALTRHDQVHIKGEFIDNGAPIRHIYVTELALVKAFNDGPKDAYDYSVKLPDDLLKASELVAKVHATDNNGHMLVIEYKDVVLPVVVEDDNVAVRVKSFYRGDRIRLHYVVRSYPNRPSHLEPDPAAKESVETLKRIVDLNGKPANLEGVLVRFPKSPEIIFDVFALGTTDEYGITDDYTLVNFDDANVFKAIREKLQAAYEAHATSAVNGRNKFVLPNVKVHAVGTFNVQSPSQANPQILLQSPDDVSIAIAK